jgi:hypothetical protein
MKNELLDLFKEYPMERYEFLDIHDSFSFWFKMKIKIMYFFKSKFK